MNFNSQIATTREQSERLLALGMKPETADMYLKYDGNPYLVTYTLTAKDRLVPYILKEKDIPAWSLSRLLELLPTNIKIGNRENVFCLFHDNENKLWNLSYPCIEYFETESPFESCISAISWLIDNGQFNKEYLK